MLWPSETLGATALSRGCAVLKLFHFLTFASLSLWERRAEGPERVAALLVVESLADSESPPRPLRGRPSRTRLVVLHKLACLSSPLASHRRDKHSSATLVSEHWLGVEKICVVQRAARGRVKLSCHVPMVPKPHGLRVQARAASDSRGLPMTRHKVGPFASGSRRPEHTQCVGTPQGGGVAHGGGSSCPRPRNLQTIAMFNVG